jgi:hypothetical protein
MSLHPVQLTSSDDLQRSRLTVFFRFLLALPHLIWLSMWAFGAILLAPVAWLATLIKGELPGGLHDFYVMFVRYATHVNAYLALGANPFPGFLGQPGSYPVDVELPAPEPQNRWTVAFRFFLALPPLMLAGALGAGAGGMSSGGVALTWSLGLLAIVPFLAWFAILARGVMPEGFRDAVNYGLSYAAHVYAYLFLLTPRYPDSDPALAPRAALPEHPVTLTVAGDDLRRSRLTVFFRGLLLLPHVIWLILWGIVVLVAELFGWLIAIVLGRLPAPLHRFFAAYVCYQTHMLAYGYLAANPFPGFTGAPGRYPIDLDLPEPAEHQSRWSIAFRWLLAVPAFLISSALGTAMMAASIGAWFASLFTGRMPHGLRNLIAYGLRYNGQLSSYAALLTERYPYSGPGPCDEREAPQAAVPAAEAA